MKTEDYRIRPGKEVDLSRFDPEGVAEVGAKEKAETKEKTRRLNERLEVLQELQHAENRHKVLIVLQATDTAGKDSTIRHVFDGTNPQGVKVHGFKQPSTLERSHDYLWRVHQRVPAAGQITIFNRSHYEDVLVVRVHGLVPEEQWQRRYKHIRDFEEMLADEGTVIRKFFLHISKDEQKKRLQDRLDDPEKHWKFSVGDLKERTLWDEYQEAFRVMLEETSTERAPWYVVPANRKWFRNHLISKVLVETLEGLEMRYPPAEEGLDSIVIE